MSFDRGFLRKPAVTRLLDRWTQEEAEAQAVKDRHAATFQRAIDTWWKRMDEKQAN